MNHTFVTYLNRQAISQLKQLEKGMIWLIVGTTITILAEQNLWANTHTEVESYSENIGKGKAKAKAVVDRQTQQLPIGEIIGYDLTEKEQRFIQIMKAAGENRVDVLSLQQAIALGLKNNLSLQSQGLQYDMLSQALREVSAIFDPTLQISLGYTDNETFERNYIGTVKRSGFRIVPDDMNPFEIPKDEDFEDENGNPIDTPPPNQPKVIEVLFNKVTAGIERGYEIEASKEQMNPNETKQYSLSISQTLPWGGEMSLSTSNIEHDIYYRKDFHWDRSWTSNFTFSIETALPFSKNFAQGYDKQLSIQLAQVEQNSGFWQVKSFLNELLARIDSAYWNLVLSYEQLMIRQENLQLIQKQQQHVQKLYEQFMVTQYDIKQIDAELAGARVNFQSALGQVKSASIQLQQLIFQDIKNNFNLLVPYQYQDILHQLPEPPAAREDLLNKSLAFHPQIQVQKLAGTSQQLQTDYAKAQTRPNVTFQADITNQQDNSQLGYQGLGEAFSAQPDIKSQSYQLQYQYPLFNRAVKSRLQQAQLGQKREQAALLEIQNNLEWQIDEAVSQLETAQYQLQLAKDIEKLAELAIEQLQNKRQIGGDYKEVEWLLNQRKLNQAKLDIIAALTDLQNAQTLLLQSQGLLAHQQLQNLPDFERYRVVELDRHKKLRFFVPLWFQ